MPGAEMILAAGGGGLVDVNPWTAVWAWVAFGITLFLLSKMAWPMLAAKMEERELRIREGLDKAEEAERRAQELLEKQEAVLQEAREEAQNLIAETRQAAVRIKQETLDAAQVEIGKERDRAKREIEVERKRAVGELREAAVELTLDAAGRVLQRSLTDDDHRRLATEVIGEVEGLALEVKNVSQTVARLYAVALNGIGESEGNLPRIVEDLHAVQELYDERGDFFEYFVSPRIEPHEKKRILEELFQDKVDRPVLGLLHVLIDKRREMAYDNIVGEFHAVRDLREGVLNAYVASARPLEPDHVGAIVQQLEQISGKKIKMHERVDPNLLGGLLIKVGDHIVDGTLRHRLELLRREMTTTRE